MDEPLINELEQREVLEGEHIPHDEVPPDPAAQAKEDAEAVKQLLAGIVRIAFVAFAPNWLSADVPDEVRVTPEHLEQIGISAGRVVDRYLPGLIERFPELFALAVSVGVSIGPPLMAGIPRFKPAPQPEAPASGGDDGSEENIP